MAHALDDAHLKLLRASEHLQQIEAETKVFLDTKPYSALPKWDLKTGNHSIRVRATGEPPSHLGLLAADALQNVRSALDHLIYQLADLDPSTPRGEKTQYPIFDTPERFDAMPKWYLEGVPGEHRAILRGAQPYNPSFELFRRLRDLNDRDKHRTLQSLVANAHMLEFRADLPDAIRDVRMEREMVYLDDDALLCEFRSDRQVPMHCVLAYRVQFGIRGGPAVAAEEIRLLINLAAELLALFRPAFD